MDEEESEKFLLADYPEKKLEYAIATFREAMQNLRHSQTMSFKVGTWGISALIIFSGWLLKQDDFRSFADRGLLASIVIGFVIALLIIQVNCRHHSMEAHKAVIRLDKAFGFFKKGEYIQNETLFPEHWSKFDKSPFWKRLSMPVSLSLIIALFVSLSVIFFR